MYNCRVGFNAVHVARHLLNGITVLAFALVPAASALTIVPTFDSTITADPNAAAIEACINSAVAVYSGLFDDNVTASILFRYSAVDVNGRTFGLARSFYWQYTAAYVDFINRLKATRQTFNDTTALASLPAAGLAQTIVYTTANGRALGYKTPGVVDASGGSTGTFDGIVTINSTQPFQFSRTGGIARGSYDAQRMLEHEINEVLGFGSILDSGVTTRMRPEDLYRYSIDTGKALPALNLNSTATAYFSIDAGVTNLVSLNQDPSGDRGDWLSPSCAQEAARPLVQYVNTCPGAAADITASSPESILLDAIGYHMVTASSGQPTILSGGVVPVFSSASSIQPGAWASIYGTNLAATNATWNGDFPTSLGGTQVTINGRQAYLWFVSANQINFQAPDDTAFGAATLVVTTSAGTVSSTVTLAPISPSFSLLDATHVAAIIVRTDGSGSNGSGVNSYDILGPTTNTLGYKTVPAQTGDHVVLFGVGFGPTIPPVAAGSAYSGAAPTADAVVLQLGDVNVSPDFAGLTSAGLYQLNFTVPPGVGVGDVPIVASTAGKTTQTGVVLALQ